jgi:hypothetical protein
MGGASPADIGGESRRVGGCVGGAEEIHRLGGSGEELKCGNQPYCRDDQLGSFARRIVDQAKGGREVCTVAAFVERLYMFRDRWRYVKL